MAIFFVSIVIIIAICFILHRNSESYILSTGLQAEGIITGVQSRSQTDQYGRVHVSYVVSYQFCDEESCTWRGKFTLRSSTCRYKEMDKVDVYYLPERPYKNVVSRQSKLR